MWSWPKTWIHPLRKAGILPVPSQGRSLPFSSSSLTPAMYSSSGPRPLPLSYKLLEGQSTQPPLIFLHGLFGSKIIFETEAKALAERTGRKVLTVDIRNHRESPSSSDCSYEAMSKDLEVLLLKLGLTPCVLIGHCMGGKIAMVLALQKNPTNRQYMINNLMLINGQYVWKVNSEALSQQMDKIMDFPQIQGSYSGPTLFLKGAKSPYIEPSHYPEIKRLFPQAQILTIQEAGHCIHVHQPQDFLNSIQNFLSYTRNTQ
ncbi:protein ABHD11-like [Monodelphis domestica]|uniref:protein ABHD11-like n=1 Tax=Monodelphis domestica TaxID=13616 RepID=UPI0024E1C04E|nr:protein ABHD11-like [Monodelphis domestica]